MKTVVLSGRYRAAVSLRLVAAVGGGYLLAAALTAAIARHGTRIGLPRSEAVLWGTLLGFTVYAAAAMGCFHCRRVWQAWLGTLLPAAVFGASLLLP